MLPAVLARTPQPHEGNFFYTDVIYDPANEAGLHINFKIDDEIGKFPLFVTTQEHTLAVMGKTCDKCHVGRKYQ
jgi:hypothetical protein